MTSKSQLPTNHKCVVSSSQSKLKNAKKMSLSSGFHSKFSRSVNLGADDNKTMYQNRTFTTTINFLDLQQNVEQQKSQQKSYIAANKKKLFNFFEDRIPRQKINVYKTDQQFHPNKIFKMRKQQDQKQQSTCMSLKQSFQVIRYPLKPPIAKVQKVFVQNNIKYSKTNPALNTQLYKKQSLSSYKHDTHSSYIKRAKTPKKQAYINVFGDDATVKEKVNKKIALKSDQKPLIESNYKKRVKALKQKQKKDMAQFSILINRLNKYSNEFNSHADQQIVGQNKKNLTQEDTNTDNNINDSIDKNQMVGLIKKISFNYKEKTVMIGNMKKVGQSKGSTQATNLLQCEEMEEIKKINPMLYNEIKEHKRSRLKVRQLALKDCLNIRQNYQQKVLPTDSKIKGINLETINHNSSQDLAMLLTITDRALESLDTDRETITRKNLLLYSYKEKLYNFSKNLIASLQFIRLYGIPANKLYDILWRIREPFQIEGSYTFFKYIKLGDLDAIRKFDQKNQDYALQIDRDGRSALVYAVQSRQHKVVDFLVNKGVNVNLKTYSKKTALYYALKSKQQQTVILLLKSGASPWSTRECNLSEFIQQQGSLFKIAVKNARKIHIAMDLMRKSEQKLILWNRYKDKINGQKIITFS